VTVEGILFKDGFVDDGVATKILTPAYGEVYMHDNSTAVTVATGATYTQMTWDSNGSSINCTPDATGNEIGVTRPGFYKVTCSTSFKVDTVNTVVLGSVFVNNVEQDQIHFRRKVATSGDEGAATCSGIIDVTAATDVDFRMRHDQGGNVDITITYGNMTIEYLGET
jgi:hypothetical protein